MSCIRSLSSAARLLAGFLSPRCHVGRSWGDALSLIQSGSCAGVSLDCFDTLLARGVPDWEQDALAATVASEAGYSAFQARDILKLARRRAQQRVGGDGEPAAVSIWTEFCVAVGIPERLAMQLCAHELALLEMTSMASYEATEFIADVEARHIAWLVCSDTRWPATALHQLLGSKGVAVSPESIFCSCDHRKSKFRGGLYSIAHRRLAEILGQPISPKNIVHIGDNFLADTCSAACFGMLAIQVPPAPRMPSASVDGEPIRSLLAGARQEIADSLR